MMESNSRYLKRGYVETGYFFLFLVLGIDYIRYTLVLVIIPPPVYIALPPPTHPALRLNALCIPARHYTHSHLLSLILQNCSYFGESHTFVFLNNSFVYVLQKLPLIN